MMPTPLLPSRKALRPQLALPRLWPLALAVPALLLSVLPAAGGPGDVLARVGDQPITQQDLERELVARHGPRVLLEMVDTQLILQVAAKEKLQPGARELGLKYEQAVARVGSERDLEEKLRRQGRTPEEFRELLRADSLLDTLAMRAMRFTDADLQAYYQANLAQFSHAAQVRARLILLTSRDNAETVAEALRGPDADFAGLAKAFSEDPATRDKGGDTGYFERQDYAREISDVAFALAPGRTSGILRVPDGFAVIKVEARRPAGPLSFAEVKSGIRSRMEMEALDGGRAGWLREARRKAALAIADEALAAQVRLLIEADEPYEPTNLTPEMPTAPR